ncbi:MAG: ribonuclease HI [Chloroflexota bacterium]
MSERPKVIIYTDGACRGNPGPGGWAAILTFGSHEKLLHGGEADTTNNRMELRAALEGLKALSQSCEVTFYTDSEYLKRGVTEWLEEWKNRHWRRKDGKLANADIWQALDAELEKHQISWHWVRGHSGDRKNERVDRLARQAIPRS